MCMISLEDSYILQFCMQKPSAWFFWVCVYVTPGFHGRFVALADALDMN